MLKVLASLTSESEIFFLLFEKHESVGRWETKHIIGMTLFRLVKLVICQQFVSELNSEGFY